MFRIGHANYCTAAYDYAMSSKGNMVRKTLAVGVLLLLFVVLGIPAFMGWQLAKIHDLYVQQLATPGLIEVRDTAFSRGILRSRSRVKLAAAEAFCGGKPCPEIVIDSTIHHGPIAFTAPPDTHGGLQVGRGVIVSHVDLASLFAPVTFTPPLPDIEAITRVDLAGATQSQWVMQGARLRAEGPTTGGRVTLDPLQASAQLPADNNAVRGSLSWPDFKLVADEGGQLGLQGLAVEFSGDATMPLFWQHFGLKLNRLQAVDAQGESLSLEGLLWDAKNTAAPGGTLAAEFDMRVSQLTAGGRGFGPVIAEGKVVGLDVASLEKLQAQIRSLSPQTLPPELFLLAMSGVYQSTIPALLASNPAVDISRLMVGTPEGDILADLHLDFDAPGVPENATDIASVMARLQLALNLRLPSAWLRALVRKNLEARRAPESPPISEQDINDDIDALTSAQFILAAPQDNAYIMQIRIENQRLTVNDVFRDGWQQLLQTLAKEPKPTKTP